MGSKVKIFAEGWLSDHLRRRLDQARRQVRESPAAQLAAGDKYIEELFTRYTLTPPEIQFDGARIAHDERTVSIEPGNERSRFGARGQVRRQRHEEVTRHAQGHGIPVDPADRVDGWRGFG